MTVMNIINHAIGSLPSRLAARADRLVVCPLFVEENGIALVSCTWQGWRE
jgi:hypothetical protein